MSENYEILKEFYEDCREFNLHEVIERWSGIGFSVPAFTGAIRDARIIEDYKAFSDTVPKQRRYVVLAKRYGLSKRKIIKAVKSATPATPTTPPTLFDI